MPHCCNYIKGPLNTKLPLINFKASDTQINLYLLSLFWDMSVFTKKLTDGTTTYACLGRSGRFQTVYWVKLREKYEKSYWLQWDLNTQPLGHEFNVLQLSYRVNFKQSLKIGNFINIFAIMSPTNLCQNREGVL